MPFSKGDGAGGPLSVKCHSNRSLSSGFATKSEDGFVESSLASFKIRLIVVFLVENWPTVDILAIRTDLAGIEKRYGAHL